MNKEHNLARAPWILEETYLIFGDIIGVGNKKERKGEKQSKTLMKMVPNKKDLSRSSVDKRAEDLL